MPDLSNLDRMHETVFDVDAERLAGVYAQACLNAAGDLAAQGALIEELESLAVDVLDPHPQLEEIFRSKLIREDEKLGIVDRLFAPQGSTTLVNMLKVMARHGRLGTIRSVVQAAYKLWEERSGKVYVELQLPEPAAESLQNEILASLRHVLGADPQVTTKINPDLIAGFVVRVGDRVYDASARTQLERSRQAMLKRAVDAIQDHPEQFIQNNQT